MTLFEIILSLAIFVAAMSAISILVTNGFRSAVRARLQNDAVLRCRSKLAELVVGAEQLEDAGRTFEDDARWKWDAEVNDTGVPGLISFQVTVSRTGDSRIGDVSYSLNRLSREGKANANRPILAETVQRN